MKHYNRKYLYRYLPVCIQDRMSEGEFYYKLEIVEELASARAIQLKRTRITGISIGIAKSLEWGIAASANKTGIITGYYISSIGYESKQILKKNIVNPNDEEWIYASEKLAKINIKDQII